AKEGVAHECHAPLRMLPDLNACEAHGLVAFSRVCRLLLDVSCPLTPVGAVMVALDFDQYSKSRVPHIGDAAESAPNTPDLHVELRFRQARVLGVEAHVRLQRRHTAYSDAGQGSAEARGSRTAPDVDGGAEFIERCEA